MKSVILSSLILISSLFLYVACGEKPQDDTAASSTSTPPIIPPVLPATCNDILVPGDCGTKALANNVAATTCVWNSDTGKCVEKPAGEEEVVDEEEDTPEEDKKEEVVPQSIEEKPAKCEDVEPKDPTACNDAELSDSSKKCEWKDDKCVEKVKVKLEKIPTTCDKLLETDCGTKDLKNNPADICAWNKTTKICVEKKSNCKQTAELDCGFVMPSNNTNCEFKNNACVEIAIKPKSCSEIMDLTKCGSTALQNAKAETCAPNNVSKKCVTRAANCKTTQKDDCGEVIPLDTKACEYNIKKCQEKVVINKCADIKNNAGQCNKTTLANGKKCSHNNKNKVCVERADDCKTTSETNCGHVKPADNSSCFYYPAGKSKQCMVTPTKCADIAIQELCVSGKSKSYFTFECKWANNKCLSK